MGSWDAPGVRRTHPILTLVLLAVAALLSVLVGVGLTDRTSILEDPPASASYSALSIWSTAAIVLVAIAVAAIRPRTRTVRVLIVALAVPVLGGAVVSTVRLSDLSSSGFIRQAQEARSEANAATAALQKELATAGAALCRGTPVAGAQPVSSAPRLVVLDERGSLSGWSSLVDRGWAPRAVADLQLAACMEPETHSVRTCSYSGGHSYEITYYQRVVRLVGARDGQVLAKADPLFGGGADCYKTIVNGNVPDGVTGDHVDAAKVLDWVAESLAP
jgi:hypothetical protein